MDYIKAKKYDAYMHLMMGPNPLKLCEELLEDSRIPAGARVCDLPRRPGTVIMLVQRGEDILIPDGSTVLRPGDVLVLHEET